MNEIADLDEKWIHPSLMISAKHTQSLSDPLQKEKEGIQGSKTDLSSISFNQSKPKST